MRISCLSENRKQLSSQNSQNEDNIFQDSDNVPEYNIQIEYLVANNGFKYWNEIIPRHIYEMFNSFMTEVPII